jgi:hypothetical protein
MMAERLIYECIESNILKVIQNENVNKILIT